MAFTHLSPQSPKLRTVPSPCSFYPAENSRSAEFCFPCPIRSLPPPIIFFFSAPSWISVFLKYPCGWLFTCSASSPLALSQQIGHWQKSLENGGWGGLGGCNTYCMICLQHTSQCSSSDIFPDLLNPFLLQHLSFRPVVMSSAPFPAGPLAPVWCLFAPFSTQTRLGGGHLNAHFPCTSWLYHFIVSFLHLHLGKNHTTWKVVPCKSMATKAGGTDLVISSFPCLRSIPSPVPPQPASSVPEGKSCSDFPGKRTDCSSPAFLCVFISF